MKKVLISVIIIMLFVSCDVLKNKSSRSTDTNSKETIENTVIRKGDTVPFLIPKFKDTLITTYNRQGSRVDIIYDRQGNASGNCYTAEIEEKNRIIKELQESKAEENKIKESAPNSQWIWAICVGFCFFILVVIIAMFLYLKSITPKIPIQ